MDAHRRTSLAGKAMHAFRKSHGNPKTYKGADKIKYEQLTKERDRLNKEEAKTHYARFPKVSSKASPTPTKVSSKPSPKSTKVSSKPSPKVSSKPSPKSTKVSPKSNSKSTKIAGKQQTPKATRKNQKGGRRSRKTRKNRK